MGWLSPRPAVEEKSSGPLLSSFLSTGSVMPNPEYPASNFLNHYAQGFAKNELVYACMSERATSAPEAPLRVYRRGHAAHGDPLEDHPFRRLVEQPNPLITEFELFELLIYHMDLAGNAFLELVRDRGGRLVELWPLRPDRVRMVRGTNKVAYRYQLDDARWVPVEVAHFRYPNPVDPLVGTPPMRPALRATALDNAATDFVKHLLDNSAMPATVITLSDLDTVLDEATTKRLEAKWMRSYGGRNTGKPAFLQTGMDVKQLGLNLRDLEFPDLRTISEARICSAFGVPPIIVGAKVGLDRSTFANYAEARKSFWQETLMPLQRRLRDAFAKQVLPHVSGGQVRVRLRFDHSEVSALAESEQVKFERAVRGVTTGVLTVNEGRRVMGYEPIDSGDIFLMPSGVIATRDMAGITERINEGGAGDGPNVDPDRVEGS